MRRWLAISTAVGVMGAAPTVALAATQSGTGGGNSPVNSQTTRWTGTAVAATSTFAPIGALTTNITAIYPVTVTVSGVVQGQPVAFNVVDHWIVTGSAEPGAVPVTPVGGHPTAFSFTWVAPGSAAAIHGHIFTIDWRRTATGSSALVKADVALTYRTDVCTGGA